jgi:antitoxin VapB
MSLNIKNEKIHRRVRELARLTGESMTTAVDTAVRERLERVRTNGNDDRLLRILAMGRECAALWKRSGASLEIDDLYDEKGLPK